MEENMNYPMNDNGLGWSEATWQRIQEAVHHECQRIRIAAKFLPLHTPNTPDDTFLQSDTVLPESPLRIEHTDTTRTVELRVEFSITKQQAQREDEWGTAVTLATRAANLLTQAEDIVIFQGQSAIDGSSDTDNALEIPQHPLFAEEKVRLHEGRADANLLQGPDLNPNDLNPQIVTVPLLPEEQRQDGERRWGENAFREVAAAYARLQSGAGLRQAHYGPYALVVHHEPYADFYAPLPTTLIMPGDRIKALVSDRVYGTGTLEIEHEAPLRPLVERQRPLFGIMVSLGGNTMDLVIAREPTVHFLTQDNEGRLRFRLSEVFALRLKDPSAVIRLEFATSTAT